MQKKALVPIADGTEELEAITIIDTLRRGGIDVTVASVSTLQVTASRGVKIVADRLIQDCVNEKYDAIILPGGMPGAEHLRDSKDLLKLLREQFDSQGILAAICASPAIILAHHGFLADKKATCYPSMQENLPIKKEAHKAVVVDGNIMTSQGPGTALEFSLKLVEIMAGPEKKEAVRKGMLG